MKPYFPIAVFLVLMLSSVCSSYCSYETQCAGLQREADRALAITLKLQQSDVITPDTVTAYRNNIAIAEIRDTAAISVKAVRIGDRHAAVIQADACCPFMTAFLMSDQRMPLALLFLALLWTAGVMWRRHRQAGVAVCDQSGLMCLGGMTYDMESGRFSSAVGEEIRFTPMQHRLMEMFFLSDSHTLPKQKICDTLWPKKPDASDTLYTLVRRLKLVVGQHSSLHIEADRGRSYVLTDRNAEA